MDSCGGEKRTWHGWMETRPDKHERQDSTDWDKLHRGKKKKTAQVQRAAVLTISEVKQQTNSLPNSSSTKIPKPRRVGRPFFPFRLLGCIRSNQPINPVFYPSDAKAGFVVFVSC